MIWRTNTPGLWRTMNPGLLFGAILVALVLVPWWAWGQRLIHNDPCGKFLYICKDSLDCCEGYVCKYNNRGPTGSACFPVADSPTTSPKRTATPAPTIAFPSGVRAKQARHWHCWLGSACRTRECVESPLACNGVPMVAWGTDPDLCPPPEQCVYYFCDGVSRELVAVPRHLCLATGGDTPEWPLP